MTDEWLPSAILSYTLSGSTHGRHLMVATRHGGKGEAMTNEVEGAGIFQEVDVIALIKIIGKKNKISQAKILQKLEKSIPDPEEYKEVRKFVLDELNNLTRAFVKATFGDIEFLIK